MKVPQKIVKNAEYEFNMFSLINVKANFNFGTHESKSLLLIFANMFHITYLMQAWKKYWYWGYICNIHLNPRLINSNESKGKTLITKYSEVSARISSSTAKAMVHRTKNKETVNFFCCTLHRLLFPCTELVRLRILECVSLQLVCDSYHNHKFIVN